jgi:periplasmic mercuric ion binding protein
MYIIIILLFTALLGTNITALGNDQAVAGSSKTDTFKVWGECGMCKIRIEKAAKTEGMIKAEWNIQTKMLTLVYNPSLVSCEDVQKRIAAVGHDTEKFSADDKAYAKLDACCKYQRKGIQDGPYTLP